VVLGVFEYLHHPDSAARKICSAAGEIVTSYCCRRDGELNDSILDTRKARGWVNGFTLVEFANLFIPHAFKLTKKILLNAPPDFDEYLLLFRKRQSAATVLNS
jgi:hypothetical protein